MKKRSGWIALLFLTVLLLAACGGARNPKDATLLFFKNMRAGKYEEAAELVSGSDFDAARVREEYESLGGKFLDKMRDFEYEVVGVDERGNNATVNVKASYYNLKPIFEEVMQNLRNDVKNDEKIRNMNEEEITKEAMNRLNAKIESVEDLQRTEKSFTINAIKSEKGWKLDITGTDVQEVISGNLSTL